jgi:hypothetical protein
MKTLFLLIVMMSVPAPVSAGGPAEASPSAVDLAIRELRRCHNSEATLIVGLEQSSAQLRETTAVLRRINAQGREEIRRRKEEDERLYAEDNVHACMVATVSVGIGCASSGIHPIGYMMVSGDDHCEFAPGYRSMFCTFRHATCRPASDGEGWECGP